MLFNQGHFNVSVYEKGCLGKCVIGEISRTDEIHFGRIDTSLLSR